MALTTVLHTCNVIRYITHVASFVRKMLRYVPDSFLDSCCVIHRPGM